MALEEQFSRTAMLMGHAALDVLRASKVAVFGVGGVGGYAWRFWQGVEWERFIFMTMTL